MSEKAVHHRMFITHNEIYIVERIKNSICRIYLYLPNGRTIFVTVSKYMIMSTWILIVLISLLVALLSLAVLAWIHMKAKAPYSQCFWKGFLVAFVLVTIVFVILRATHVLPVSLVFGLPVALCMGSLTGLLAEVIRNRMMGKNFWKNC